MSKLLEKWLSKLHNMRSLKFNWDGKGAPKPSEIALNKAETFIQWAHINNFEIEDIDADVLGGVAIYLLGINSKKVWISIRNNGIATAILYYGNGITRGINISNSSALTDLIMFLTYDEQSVVPQMKNPSMKEEVAQEIETIYNRYVADGCDPVEVSHTIQGAAGDVLHRNVKNGKASYSR